MYSTESLPDKMSERMAYPKRAGTIGPVSGKPETGGDAASLEKLNVPENHRRLAAAVEQAAESFILLDKYRTVRYVNPAFERLMGCTREETINREPDFFKRDGHHEAFHQTIWDTVGEGRVWTGRLTHRMRNATPCEVEMTISPVQDEVGTIQNYVIILRDVSHEAKLEKQLRQVQKMEAIGALAGGIAHDFNNILAPILGYAELALRKISKDDPFRNNFELIFNSARRATELVKQILTFSRQTEQERRTVQAVPIVKEVLKLLRASLPSTIEIRRKITPEAASSKILADPTQIHQIVMNLCANAGYAMRKKGGVLDVSMAVVNLDAGFISQYPSLKPGPHVRLSISDTGIGMDEKTRQRIFEPYFTTKPQGDGTGMGLAVVYGIVKNHGGAISVYSEPGTGSIFHVFFPAIKAKAPPNVNLPPTIPTGTERILFVDDEQSMVRMGQEMLNQLGYTVSVRYSSIDALEAFRAKPDQFDLIITDQTMPNMTGTDLAGEILKIRSDIPIILCTGFSELIDEKEAKSMGFGGFLMKPILMADMANVIREVLPQKS